MTRRMLPLLCVLALGCASSSRRDEGPSGAPGDSDTRDGGEAADALGHQQPPLESFGDLCAATASLLCDTVVPCCEGLGLSARRDFCEQLQREQRMFTSPDRSCRAPVQEPERFDGDAAALCISLARDHYDACAPRRHDDPALDAQTTACSEAVPTELPGPGDDCEAGYRCAAPEGQWARCIPGTDGYPTLCDAPSPRRPLGDRCDSLTPCLEHLRCDPTGLTCVEPLADAAACTIGETCGSGFCDAGSCAPPPSLGPPDCEQLDFVSRHALYVPGQGATVLVNDRGLFWLVGGQLWRGAKDGSAPPRVVADLTDLQLRDLAIDDTHLYQAAADGVLRTNLQTGDIEALAVQHAADGLAVDGGDIYVAGNGCASLTKLPADGGPPQTRTASLGPADYVRSVGGLVVTDGAVFCASTTELFRFDEGAAQGVLMLEMFDVRDMRTQDIAVAAGKVWVLGFATGGGVDLYSVPTSGGGLTRVPIETTGSTNLLQDTDRNLLYFGRPGVASLDPVSGAQARLETVTDMITGPLAHDADFLYWTTGAAILRAPK